MIIIKAQIPRSNYKIFEKNFFRKGDFKNIFSDILNLQGRKYISMH